MKYYDNIFRKNLLELLSSCRKVLQQVELSSTDNNYIFFITDTIKKVDEACKVISPSPFDFLSERKLEKLQSDEFLKQKAEEYDSKLKQVRKKVADELREKLRKEIMQECQEQLTEEIQEKVLQTFREQLTAEIRAELEPQIKAELKKEREIKKQRKKERKEAKALGIIQSELLHLTQETQKVKLDERHEKTQTSEKEKPYEDNFEYNDDFDIIPDFESIE